MVEEGRETNPDRGEADQGRGDLGVVSTDAPPVSLRELVDFLARNLVTSPDAVNVSEKNGDEGILYELRVDKDDLGRVIGKQGRTAKSLRTILNAAASKANVKVSLEIIEE
jgi:predicted RNA-binding protein YlqC (UPF0109 family)